MYRQDLSAETRVFSRSGLLNISRVTQAETVLKMKFFTSCNTRTSVNRKVIFFQWILILQQSTFNSRNISYNRLNILIYFLIKKLMIVAKEKKFIMRTKNIQIQKYFNNKAEHYIILYINIICKCVYLYILFFKN